MKKTLFTLAIVLMGIVAQAQIKVYDDNWVSIGCLNHQFGIQVTPIGYTYFRAQDSTEYSWATLSKANSFHQKHWIVENQYLLDSLGKHMFYVLGNGHVYSKGCYIIPKDNGKITLKRDELEPIDSRLALATVLGIKGFYYEEEPHLTPEDIESNEYVDEEAVEGMLSDLGKRGIGLSGTNLAEVLPEAVRTDPEARLCINYHAVVTMLIEAVKEQQNEIERLQQILEENGLMRKQP